MEILEKAPECYIQQCKNCGAVLRYSECDIHAADIPFKSDDGRDWVCSCDTFICPSCKLPIAAERTWFTGVEWIKKILDRI